MMSANTLLYLAHVVGTAGFLWLGLYILTRGDGRRLAILVGVTALATACFFLSGGVLSVLHGPPQAVVDVNRASWWATVVPVVLWLHVSLGLNPAAAGARWLTPALWAAYAVAAALVVLGTATDLISNYHSTVPSVPVTTGSGYVLYVVYLFLGAGLATLNFAVMVRQTGRTPPPTAMPTAPAANGRAAPQATRAPADAATEVRSLAARLLLVGAVCFLLGAGQLALNVLLRYPWNELPAYLLLLAGLCALGATMAVESALLLGTDVRRDAVYNLTWWAILLALYLVAFGALVGFDTLRSGVCALLLAILLTAGHTLQDTIRDWLDAAFFSPAIRGERAAARAYATALATPPAGPHPDLATRKAFDDAVRRALTHLSDPTRLATSPLLNLAVVAQGIAEQHLEDNRLARATVLKELLIELLDGLRPQDTAQGVTGDALRYYNCLYYPYVRDLGRRRAPTVLRQLAERRRREGGPRGDLEQVLDWLLQVDEDTFYKWQRRGSDTIAAALREREVAAGGVVPAEAGPAAPREEALPLRSS